MRDSLLRIAVLSGAATIVISEVLSPFHLLTRGALIAAWVTVCAVGIAAWLRWFPRPFAPRPRWLPFETCLAGVTAAIAGVVGVTAVLSPPNSADAMAYHLPRVIYWAQSGSVGFFPTPYFNQIMLQPLAEYFMLHTYLLTGLLTGGDRLVNLVAFAAYAGSIMGVSAVAGAFALNSRAQAWAALFCATLPNAILQASGAKNDFVLAFWLVCVVYFAARRDVPMLAIAAALALATKGTAYLFLPPLLGFAAVMWRERTRPDAAPEESVRRRRAGRAALIWGLTWMVGAVLAINGPQYARNLQLSGSPLGFDSAQGDGVYRWRNEHLGLKAAVSNALRHTSEQLGARSPQWNQRVYRAVLRIHRALRIDPQDRDTTWPGAQYGPPLNANHEANANNRWHLLLILLAAIFAAATRNRQWTLYSLALLCAFLLFCFYLKWQPFLARLELPLLVLGAPLAAFLVGRLRYPAVAVLLAIFLVNNARPALFENWTRPLKGPHSLFVTARDDNYFNDMGQWNNKPSYLESVDRTARSGCELVGLDISENQLEYPFQALLRERRPGVRFVHTGVVNASARYAPKDVPRPCAVLCPDCAGNRAKLAMYRDFGAPTEIGRFLLFMQR